MFKIHWTRYWGQEEQQNASADNPDFNASSNTDSEPITQPWPIDRPSRIFDSELRDALIEIINQLDPVSLVTLGRTCRLMNDICFKTQRIAVRYGEDDVLRSLYDDSSMLLNISILDDDSKPEGIKIKLVRSYYRDDVEERHFFTDEEIEKLTKMPFLLWIQSINLYTEEEINTRQLDALQNYLHRFRRVTVGGFMMFYVGTSDWNKFADFVQEFRVGKVDVLGRLDTPIPENVQHFFATNLVEYQCVGYISDDVVLAMTAKTVFISGARIAMTTFKVLLEKFVTGEISTNRWAIGRPPHDGIHESDPFLNACSEFAKVVQVEDLDFAVMEPGVLYWSSNEPRESAELRVFHLLRTDGSTGKLRIEPRFVCLNWY